MVSIGIVGSGYMGRTHAEACQKLDEVIVKAIVSRKIENAKALANKCGARAYTSLEEMLKVEDIDIVDICYPTFCHRDLAVEAAKAGKHILLEKPLASDLEEADEIKKAVEEAGVRIMIAHVLRFVPAYQVMRDAVVEGKIGHIQLVSMVRVVPHRDQTKDKSLASSGEWSLDPHLYGGAVMDFNIHDFDYICWLMGKPKSIYSKGLKSAHGAWDHVITLIEYGDNKIACSETSFDTPEGYIYMHVTIKGDKGCLDFTTKPEPAVTAYYYNGRKPETLPIPDRDPFADEIEYFIRCLNENREPEFITFDEARNALRMCLAATESMENNEPVKF